MDRDQRPTSRSHAAGQPPAELIDPRGHVAIETRCRSCGYPLQTLPASSACPECGTAIAASLRADLLAVADANWLRRVRGGLRLAIATWLLAIPLAGGWHLLDRAEAAGVIGPGGAAAVNVALWATPSCLLAVAVWLMTSPEPGRVERTCSARRVARIGIEAGLVVMFASVLATERLSLQGPPPVTTGDFLTSTIFLAVNVVVMACNLSGWLAMFAYGTGIARRVPSDRLVRWTRLVMWSSAIVRACALAAMAAAAVLNEVAHRGLSMGRTVNAGVQSADLVTTGLMPIIAVAGLGMMIWFLVMLRSRRLSPIARRLRR